MRQNQLRNILIFLITLTRKPRNSGTKMHFSTEHTLSTRNQWMPLVPFINSQIHVTPFPPMAKLLHTHKSLQYPQFLYSLRDEGLTLEMSAFHIFTVVIPLSSPTDAVHYYSKLCLKRACYTCPLKLNRCQVHFVYHCPKSFQSSNVSVLLPYNFDHNSVPIKPEKISWPSSNSSKTR